MATLTCGVETTLLARYPGYRRGVVWATRAINDESPYSLVRLLQAAIRSQPDDADRLTQHPRVLSWNAMYAATQGGRGVATAPFAPLLDNTLRQNRLPRKTVMEDIATLLSLWHLTPVTAYALEYLHTGLTLKFASGQESLAELATTQGAHAVPGEIIVADGERVMTRGWHGTIAPDARVTLSTAAVALVIDALPELPQLELQGMCEEAVSLFETFCRVISAYHILDQNSSACTLS